MHKFILAQMRQGIGEAGVKPVVTAALEVSLNGTYLSPPIV